MLKILRNRKTAKRIWIVLTIIILPAFAFWGFGTALRNRQEGQVKGKLFGRTVTDEEFKDALDAVTIQALIQFGDKFSEARKYLDLQSEAWKRMVLLHEARRRGLKASDVEVIETIEGFPFFQRNGAFDNKTYAQMLQYAFRTQPRIFEEQIRQNVILLKLYDQVTSGVKLNADEIRYEYRKANEEVSLTYIASKSSEFSKGLAPDENELKSYFQNNSLAFKEPLSFNIGYASIDSQDKIKQLSRLLTPKSDFAKAAKTLGMEVKETGLFTQGNPIPGIGWFPEIIEMISQLKTGQCTKPVALNKHYYIFCLKEKKEAHTPDYEKIKDKVRAEFIKDKSQELAKEKIKEALRELKESPRKEDFRKIAGKLGLKTDSTDNFKFGSYIEGIGSSDDFWLATQGLSGSDFSEIITTTTGFYIAKVKQRSVFDDKKFEQDKDNFSRKVLQQKKEEIFSRFLTELLKKAQ